MKSSKAQADKKSLRRPGIEPGSQEWESCMIPLHQRRSVSVRADTVVYITDKWLVLGVQNLPGCSWYYYTQKNDLISLLL